MIAASEQLTDGANPTTLPKDKKPKSEKETGEAP